MVHWCCLRLEDSLVCNSLINAPLSVCCQGSGKTLAFAIPLVHHILLDKERDSHETDTSEVEDDERSRTSDGIAADNAYCC